MPFDIGIMLQLCNIIVMLFYWFCNTEYRKYYRRGCEK